MLRCIVLWSIGSVWAGVLSWMTFHSLLLLLPHIMLGWFYVAFHFLFF